MKILVISGFLGSGKTTFIREFSKHLDDVVILENEVARDVDRELLSSDGSQVYSIDEGCACCTTADQFANTIISLSAQLNPEYLIIEPTGVAKLSSIIKRIQRIEYERIQYLGSIAIVELTNYQEVLKQYKTPFLDSLKNSDLILFSKSENEPSSTFKKSIEELSEYTQATFLDEHYSNFDINQWEKVANVRFKGTLEESAGHVHVQTLSYESVHFSNQREMSTVFNVLMTQRFGTILRAKGGFTIAEHAYQLDIVREQITIKPTNQSLSQIVFIGENLEEASFDTLFKKTYRKDN